MKINIDLENLQDIIETTAKESTKNTIEEAVKNVTLNYINDNFKDSIEDKVSEAINNSITNYIQSAEIKVGGGFSNEPEVTYTPQQYINKCVTDYITKNMLTIKKTKKNYWNTEETTTTQEISFKDYIENQLDWTTGVKTQLDKFAQEMKKDINAKIKTQYNNSLKEALSQVVLDSLMENKKFKEINDGVKDLL